MEPVPLTREQISSILQEVPDPPGVGKNAIRIAKQHFTDQLKDVLKRVRIYPIQDAFEEFKEDIIRNIYESHIESGRPVGVTSAGSLGGPITQLSLNSFHFAGAQSGVALAFQGIRDLLTGSKMNRDPQMKIFFKKSGTDFHDVVHTGTFESIISKRPEFEQTTVSDVVIDSQILGQDEAEMEGIPEMINLHAQLYPERFNNYQERFRLTYVVALTLNTYRMYTHRITMKMLCSAIEGPAPPDALTCVWQSQFAGTIYILVDNTKDYGQQAISQSAAIIMFLNRQVIRQFDIWKISGITNISSIEPRDIDVLKGIYRIKRSIANPEVHYVYTNNYLTRWAGISLGDIHNLLEVAGFQPDPITDIHKDKLYIKAYYNGDLRKALEEKVNNARNKSRGLIKFTLEEEAVRAKIKVQSSLTPEEEVVHATIDQKLKLTPEEIRIAEASTYWYMETSGNNMNDIVWRDDIDLYRTMSNNSHEIADTLGIDAARIFLIFRFRQTLEKFSSYINGRHISLIFDLLTNLGIINSLSYTGINRRKAGPLTEASFERAMDVFKNAAAFGGSQGNKQGIVGVSPAIFLGQRSKRVGTGSIAIEEDLMAIPQDRPTMPLVDDITILTDDLVPEYRDNQLMKLMFDQPDPKLVLSGGPINKDQPTALITDVGLSEIRDIPVPSGAQVFYPSQTLMNALTKLTTNTQLEVSSLHEPIQERDPAPIITPDIEDIPDISEIEDVSGLELITPQRAIPATSSVPTDLFTQMKQIPPITAEYRQLEPKTTPSIFEEEVIRRNERELPLSPSLSHIPSDIPGGPKSGEKIETVQVRGVITEELVPELPSPPRTSIPEPPSSEQIVSITYDQPDGTISPNSFIDLLPDLSAVTIPTSVQGNVSGISIQAFSEQLSSIPTRKI